MKKIMSFKQYRFLKKHFRVTKLSKLPDKSSLEYHPPQNILKGTETASNTEIQHLVDVRREDVY